MINPHVSLAATMAALACLSHPAAADVDSVCSGKTITIAVSTADH